MKKKFTLLIPLVAMMFGYCGSAWGQAHIGTSLTHANNVNNEFGAGETATITSGQVTFPGTARAINTPPPSIRLGSSSAHNIVINSYNSNGYYQDWLYHYTATWTNTNNTHNTNVANYPVAPADAAMPYGAATHVTGAGVHTCNYSSACAATGPHSHQLWDGGTFTPYVSHTVTTDDGVGLVQLSGATVNSTPSYNTALGVPAKTDGGTPALTRYQRPTTVAIVGTNTFSEFRIMDLRWWYNTYNVRYQNNYPTTDYHSNTCYNPTSNWHNQTCFTSGGSSYNCSHWDYLWTTGKDATKHDISLVAWVPATHLGSTFLDAAIQIVGGANVCLRGSVTDNTSGVGSQGGGGTTGATDAMVVYPPNGQGNFMLRMRGDYNYMQQKHDGIGAGAHLQYLAATFPTTGDADIFLYSGSTVFDWRGYASDGTTPLTIFGSGQYNDISFPNFQTSSSVFGVYGNYHASNANVYTNTSTAQTGNNGGVIEVGPATTGQHKFFVSSGGILKNFSSACDPSCHTISFTGTNAPTFAIGGTWPLSILNTGDCCNAAIVLAGSGVTNVEAAVNSATANGDLLVQAHGGHVTLQTAVNFLPPAGQDNNVALLSDLSYISTQGFGYTAAGGGLKGHVTLWAKGTPGTCNGYVLVTGDFTSSSTAAASGWQTLTSAVQRNSQNLANFASCGYNEEMSARMPGALATGMQTRVQSDNDYVTVTGNFFHTGKDGGLFVQGDRKVEVTGTTTIDFAGNTGIGDAVIQSKSANVLLNGALVYKGHQTSDLFVDGETGVEFRNGSLIEYTDAAASAHIGVQSNAGSIAFTGAPFAFNNTSIGNTQIWAGNNFTTAAAAPLTFTYKTAASGQHIDVYAGQRIVTDGTLTFMHNDATAHTGMIALRAFTHAPTLFAGVSAIPGVGGDCPVRCADGATSPNRGDVWLNNAVTIDYEGNAPVWIAANHDVDINHNYTHTAGSAANAQTGHTRIVAGNDVTTGKTNATTTAFIYLHQGASGNFDMKAGNDIITHNKMNVIYDGSAATTAISTWKACRNIDIRNAFTYLDEGDAMDVRWYANNDILTNFPGGVCAPYTYGAPVTFGVTNNKATTTKTEWNAGRNIHTEDSVIFNYQATSNSVRDLTLIAQGGNIEMDRYVNINYDSDNLILLSAEMQGAGMLHNGVNSFATNRNTIDGNILLNDSTKIIRNNLLSGKTDILAKYNIRTAMFNYEDQMSANGNNTDIISHIGDIFLGYSTNVDNCVNPTQATQFSYDLNRFLYTVKQPTTAGKLNIKAGYGDATATGRDAGGNIYFTHIQTELAKNGTYGTEISIPFSNEYSCRSAWSPLRLWELTDFASPSRMMYEHAGIIAGVGPCGHDDYWTTYTYLPSQRQGNSVGGAATDTSLIYHGNNGNLLVDAGTRGNIIINRGGYLNFQQNTGISEFRTRDGNIDMRYPFNADSLQGSLLFLASSDLPNKLKTGFCGCEENRNNIYLQDFRYHGHLTSGSVFVGADNNIKLQYGGLKNIGTERDPFFSPNNNGGYRCGDKFHCDADTTENQARALILNFAADTFGAAITKGGFAAVASDLIDVYKNMIYHGGQGTGLSAVPVYNSLHGESVAGYGLFIKTQANKDNWNKSDHDVNQNPNPTVGAACDDDQCNGNSYLHQVARVTFHSDARIYTENQRSLIASPVLDVYGFLDLNTHDNKGSKTSIQIQTDSLIMHDSVIIDGKLTKFSSWSQLNRGMPVFKFGHQRMSPPAAEDGGYCAPCYAHEKDTWKKGAKSPLDTIFVTFRNGASVERLHTLVADHAILSFLTDSFDHVKGDPTINATFYADTFKIRNHVELFRTTDHTHDGHFELVSEPQMKSKAYAGIFSRHLHMEPIAPACSRFGYSQMWQLKPQLNVVTTSTFGGFGWLHSDVHVEIGANLFPGYASLQKDGNCYEQKAGILKMEDLRLDKGANLKFSLGEKLSPFVEEHACSTGTEYQLGGYADCLDVDSLSIYGEMFLEFVIRPEGLDLVDGESRCFPIIRYKSVGDQNLNHLKLKKDKFTSKDHPSIIGTYYLNLDFDTLCNVVNVCVGTTVNPTVHRKVEIPSVAGVTTNPPAGIRTVKSGNDFRVKIVYTTPQPLKVMTGRSVNGAPEEIWGWLNPNGEYEYTIHRIIQDIRLEIGPDVASSNPGTTESLDGVSVWSNDQTIYVRVKREDIATIYSVSGQLVKRVEIPEGETLIPMHQGVYVVTLKDGSVHKVIVK